MKRVEDRLEPLLKDFFEASEGSVFREACLRKIRSFVDELNVDEKSYAMTYIDSAMRVHSIYHQKAS